MKIVIIGDGKIGSTMSNVLCSEGHDVVIVDKNASALAATLNAQDILCVEGNGAVYDVQMEAGVSKADLLIACTATDELNMLACLLAKKIGAKATIARVRDPEYDKQLRYIKEDLGLSMSLNPEYATAQEIARLLTFPAATKIELFARGRVELVEFKLAKNSILDGMSLSQIYKVYKIRILVCAVQRGHDVFIPNGDFVLHSEDKLHISASHGDIEAFFKTIHGLRDKAGSIIIVGGGKIAYYLANRLLKLNMKVKIIEKDYDKCEKLSELLPKVTIIHGNGTHQALLQEEGINQVDGFVALTGVDEENIVMSIFAKNCNVAKVISKVNRHSYMEMAESLGLDTMVSPRLVAANNIARFARAMENSLGSNVETLCRLVDGRVEALEFTVREASQYVHVPLRDLKLRDGALIASIVRQRVPIIPTGDSCIEVGDNVVVVTTTPHLHDLKEIFVD